MKKKRNSLGLGSSLGSLQQVDLIKSINNNKNQVGYENTSTSTYLISYGLVGILIVAASISVVESKAISVVDDDSDIPTNYRRQGSLSNPSYRQRIISSSSSAIVFPDEPPTLINHLKSKSKKKVLNYKGDEDNNQIQFPYEQPTGGFPRNNPYPNSHFVKLTRPVIQHLPVLRPNKHSSHVQLMDRLLDEGDIEIGGPLPNKRCLERKGNSSPSDFSIKENTPQEYVDEDGESFSGSRNNVDSQEVPRLVQEFTEYLKGKNYFQGNNNNNNNNGHRRKNLELTGPQNFSFQIAGVPERNCTEGTVKSGDECKVDLD